jgi:PAS domain S-box-containing protein
VMTDDYDHWEGRAPDFPMGVVHAGLAVPMSSAGQVVGVIGLSHQDPGRSFGQDEIDVLSRLAELASIALDNARLYDAAREEVAERQRVQRELERAETRYRTLVEQIPAITYIDELDPDAPRGYSPVYVSPQIESVLGYSAAQFIAEPGLWADLLHPDDRERSLTADATFYQRGGHYRDEYRLISKAGAVVWVQNAAEIVRDETGHRRFAQGVLYDITERKRAEAELQRALAREREAGQRLRALDEMKNTFLHAVSHELRTPLSSVLGLALTLQRQDVRFSPEEVRDLLNRLASNARKLDRLLSDLLDLDRLDRGIVAPMRRPTDLAVLIRRTVETAEFLAGREVHVDAAPLEIAVDAPKVERIVENLLANASRHTPPGTPLWVRLFAYKDGAVLAVEDSGQGVAEHLRASIFEPFHRGPDAPSHAPGVGIGLSLVARFAELHGGRAWVEARPGGGASFRVYLPDGYPFSTGAPTSDPYSVQEPS